MFPGEFITVARLSLTGDGFNAFLVVTAYLIRLKKGAQGLVIFCKHYRNKHEKKSLQSLLRNTWIEDENIIGLIAFQR